MGRQPDLICNGCYSNAKQPDPLIQKSWLDVCILSFKLEGDLTYRQGKDNWPECLERTLETFMKDNHWYSYKKKQSDSHRNMGTVIGLLQRFFDLEEWDEVYTEKLRKKVRNKMYRLNNSEPLTKFRIALRELPIEAHSEATRDLIDVFGEEIMNAVLMERGAAMNTGTDELEWLNWDDVS